MFCKPLDLLLSLQLLPVYWELRIVTGLTLSKQAKALVEIFFMCSLFRVH